jgi:membrane associated rhomboid family serine protease
MIAIPVTVDVPMQRLPWANWLLIVLTLAVSIFVFFDDKHEISDEEAERIAAYLERTQPRIRTSGGPFARIEMPGEDTRHYPWTGEQVKWMIDGPQAHPLALHPARLRVWQVVTNVFVHGGWVHLIVLMVFLFCFGNAVNTKLGHLTYLFAFFNLGVLSNLDIVLTGNQMPTFGANGAIMGIVGIFVVLYPRNDVLIFYWLWAGGKFTGIWRISAFVVVLAYLAVDVIALLRGSVTVAGFVSHLLAAGVGVAVGLVLLKVGWIKPERGEQTLPQLFGWLEVEQPVPKYLKKRTKVRGRE